MLDFTELGLNIKHKTKIYISSTHKKQTTMHSRRQTKPLIPFNKFHDEKIGHGLRTFTAVSRSIQPSTLRGTVKMNISLRAE